MLSSLQETQSFVQNLQESLVQQADQVNVCEIKQAWQQAIAKVDFPKDSAHEVEAQLDAIVENLSRAYVNKVLEMSLYKQAIAVKGTDA